MLTLLNLFPDPTSVCVTASLPDGFTLNKDGTTFRYKSRFVVCGYSQRPGIHYERTFSATLRAASFRTLLAIAAGKKMRLIKFDASNAFVQANMDDADVFIPPPKGFETYETVKGKKVSLLLYLKRALYGTKQGLHV